MKVTRVVAGVDVGGTFTKIGLVDREGKVLKKAEIETKGKTFDHYVKQLSDTINTLKDKIANAELVGIGVGAPSSNYYKGCINANSNLPWKEELPLVEKLKSLHPKIPVVLTNDANAATIGEMVYGGAKKLKDFMLITLGTGLGSGFVANGKIIYGQDSNAGELGHTIVVPDGRQCGCGRKGCLETYVSATGICRTVAELLATTKHDSVFRDKAYSKITSEDIAKAAQKGDVIAKEAFSYTGKMLGFALANAIAITAPKAIFLFGGLAKAGKLILEPTKKSMEENVLFFWSNKVKLQLSALQEENIAVLGASALAWEEDASKKA